MAAIDDIIRQIRGRPFEAGAHRSLSLCDPERVYLVAQGHLDIFAAEFKGEEMVSRRPFTTRIPEGSIGFGAPRASGVESDFGFLAVPSQNAVIVEGERAGLTEEGIFDINLILSLDEWVSRLSELLVRASPPVSRDAMLLEADPDVPYPGGATLSAHHSDVVWISADGPVRLMGREEMLLPAGEVLPLCERTWVETGEQETRVSASHTPRLLVDEMLWPALYRFSESILLYAGRMREESAAALSERHEEVREAHSAAGRTARWNLGGVLGSAEEERARDTTGLAAAEAAMGLVAESVGAEISLRGGEEKNDDPLQAFETIARRSGVSAREIALTPEWWKHDGPSFAGVTKDGKRPIAVLSNGGGRYTAVDPATNHSFAVGRRNAAQIENRGVMLYAPFKAEVRDGSSALRDVMRRRTRDIHSMFTMSLLAGLVALVTPLLTGRLLADIIPRIDMPMWIAALGALLFAALGATAFQLVRSYAMLRVEGRLGEDLQSALWSRLLALSARFFRLYSAADLADRLGGVTRMRMMLAGGAMNAIMSGIFSVFSFALLLYYSWRLALAAAAMVVTLLLASALFSYLQMKRHRAAFAMKGAIDATIFQTITGLAKLRMANAEPYVLARWAEQFAGQQRETLSARKWAAAQFALNGLFIPMASFVLLAMIWHLLVDAASPASFGLLDFLVSFTAFGQLAGAMAGLTGAAATVIAVIPLFERVKPVLEAEPDTAMGDIDPGDLTGEIELSGVSFRYHPDGENELTNISLRIEPGDYVAIVGASGSGKSTIYRLLLGFERPDSGAILFDGHDLLSLDLGAVRSHMGVVLQNGQLIADSIYSNIASSSQLSMEDAWAAVRAAGLEEDVQAMPMGLHTVLHEGGGGLSGGQKQRLLIARALARKPRILMFDEATSSLDNRTQAIVQEALGKLSITRLVIAHRVSTVREVDCIYVLDKGGIVESGNYNELMTIDGAFAKLAKRQLT